ncbi:MAG: hypothetical protein Q9210_006736 [Variospora velana]
MKREASGPAPEPTFEFNGTGMNKWFYIDVDQTSEGTLTWDNLGRAFEGILICAFHRQTYNEIHFEIWERNNTDAEEICVGVGEFGMLNPAALQAWIRQFKTSVRGPFIHFPVHKFQYLSASGHERTAETEKDYPPRRRQKFEYGVWIPAVVAVTLLYPEPISECESSAQAKCLAERNSPGWRKQQVVDSEKDGGHGMEANIGQQAQLELLGNDELLVYRHKTAVEGGDEYFQGCCDDGKKVLVARKSIGGSKVGERSQGEGDCGEKEADDGQEFSYVNSLLRAVLRAIGEVSSPQNDFGSIASSPTTRGAVRVLITSDELSNNPDVVYHPLCLDPRKLEGLSPRPGVATDAGSFAQVPGSSLSLTVSRPCKNRKIKCGEEKPQCQNCERAGESCDYSIRLNWQGRGKRNACGTTPEPSFIVEAPSGETQNSSDPRHGIPMARADQRPPLKTSENQGSNRSLESIEEYKRKLQFTPDEDQSQSSRPAPRLPWIDPALTDTPNQGMAFSELTQMPRSPGRIAGGYQGVMSLGPRETFPSTRPLSRSRDAGNAAYPSPNSNVESPPAIQASMPTTGGTHLRHPSSNAEMPPPFQAPFTTPQLIGLPRKAQEESTTAEYGRKRMRLSPAIETLDPLQPLPSPQYNMFGPGATSILMGAPTQNVNHINSPYSSNFGMPPTPAASSVTSDDAHNRSLSKIAHAPQESPDLRRLSVKSLLSDDSPADSGNETPFITSTVTTPIIDYGVDRGFPDLDVPRNNDAGALNGSSPLMTRSESLDFQDDAEVEGYFPLEFGFGLYGNNSTQDQGGYYAKPVTVTIARGLLPLPSILQDNPMNLLYFHHFLNHTARILVPHDCSANPFRNILPQMAVRDINLMHLLLAYSASHRALLLKHPEPATRIANWVKDVFPTLRRALDDPDGQVSTSNLATAIMLASLEIISPNAFEVTVPWQTHLTIARRMILARGGAESVHRKDKVSYFLSRWFAYLDVLGSLSGGKNDRPLFSGNYWANDDNDGNSDGDFQIDCLLGFTSRCVSILACIAELARQCDGERIDPNTGDVREGWSPSAETVVKAEQLKHDLQDARMHRYKGCPHRPSTPLRHRKFPSSSSSSAHQSSRKDTDDEGWDLLEMVATNEAFHWAGLVHLHRRILGKRSGDLEVQIAVREIVSTLYKVRKGGTAEACLLFPMFTAGCDAQERGQRDVIMERLRCVEESGMTQVHKARTLIEKVWETGRSWETLVSGEFFG